VVPFLNPPGNSTIDLPLSSWIALYAEMGAIGLAALALLIVPLLLRLRRARPAEFPYLTFMMFTLVLYVLLLGAQDAYWEYTQSLFPAALLVKVAYDFLGLGEAGGRIVAGPACETPRSSSHALDAVCRDPAQPTGAASLS